MAKMHVCIATFGISGVGKGTLASCFGPAGSGSSLSRKHGSAEQQYKQRFHETRAKEVKTKR